MKQIVAIIPTRYDSQRFPGKVLTPLYEKPLLFYVWRAVSKAKLISRVIIATDDSRIRDAAETFGAEVIRTSKKHRTGSDRAAEVYDKVGGQIIINVQADNFGLSGSGLDSAIRQFLEHPNIDFATLGRRIADDSELFDPNTVKVIADNQSNCLYFSRYPLPYLQHCQQTNRVKQYPFFKHIGIYLFTYRGIKQYASWRRGPLEKAESLEQLRILENGKKIQLIKSRLRTISVDTKEDLKKIETLYT